MTKPREKTREELTAEIEDGKKKIRQLENWEKVLRQKLSVVNNSTHFDISKSTLLRRCDQLQKLLQVLQDEKADRKPGGKPGDLPQCP